MKDYPISEETANSPSFWGAILVCVLLATFACLILADFIPNTIL